MATMTCRRRDGRSFGCIESGLENFLCFHILLVQPFLDFFHTKPLISLWEVALKWLNSWKKSRKFTQLSTKNAHDPLNSVFLHHSVNFPVLHPVYCHSVLFRRSFLRQEDGAAPVEVRRCHFPLRQPGTPRSVDPRPQRAAVITQ